MAAGAHAEMSPKVSLSGQLQLYSLAVPTEKSGATTTQIALNVPSGFSIDSFVPTVHRPDPRPGERMTGEDMSGERMTGGRSLTRAEVAFRLLAAIAVLAAGIVALVVAILLLRGTLA